MSNKTIDTAGSMGHHIDMTFISAIFDVLQEQSNNDVAIEKALCHIAKEFHASRCFIVESFDEGKTYNFTHEWCSSMLSQAPFAKSPSLDYHKVEALFNNSNEMGVFACGDVNTCALGSEMRTLLKERGTKSFLHTQIERNGFVAFCLGIADCCETRVWTEVQLNTMHYLSRIFSIVLHGKHLNEEMGKLSDHSKISAFIGDNTNNFIYIVDPENYEMIHMNKTALEMYSNPEESVWRNKKCYEILHDKTQPCEFCTNKYVTEDDFYEWTYYHPKFDKTYLFKDKLIHLNGKLVKLQVATNITKLVMLETELKNSLEEQTLLLNCIKMLHAGETPDANIEKILNNVCEFFGSDSGLIIQIDDNGFTTSNTHEWTRYAELSRKNQLQYMPLSSLQNFFDNFSQKLASYTDDISKAFSKDDDFYAMLKKAGIKSFICAPISDANGKFVGMIGIENPTKNTEKHWILASISVFVADFLEKNKLIISLNNLSYYDALTGVKNRVSYMRELQKIDEGQVHSLGVAYIDIKALSRINEEKGARYGDEILRKITQILSDIFNDNVYRVGGDEFVVLIKNIGEIEFEDEINLLKSVIFEESELRVSIGYTWNTHIADNKAYDFEKHNTVWNNSNYTAILGKNLDEEIARGKYPIYLQPQINLKTMKLSGAEALIRRLDANGNVQSPVSFVPFYEKEGMISKIDLHVFESVCILLSNWHKRGIDINLKFSVNFSRSTIMEKQIVGKLCDICEKYKLEKSLFVIEITETINHTDDNVFSHIISSFKNVGFCVSLDDFGSGLSNLSALKISDFDEIKIDMGLVRDLHIDERSKILAKVALTLCNEFGGMISVAEGIENEAQCKILTELNCDVGQGYLFSKPLEVEVFEKQYMNEKHLKLKGEK